MRYGRLVAAIALIAGLASCKTVGGALNPWEEGPPCQLRQDGKCQSVAKTYAESVEATGPLGDGPSAPPYPPREREMPWWQFWGGEELAASQMPERPLVTEARVGRFRFFAYKGSKGALYGARDAWVIIEPPRFTVGAIVKEK